LWPFPPLLLPTPSVAVCYFFPPLFKSSPPKKTFSFLSDFHSPLFLTGPLRLHLSTYFFQTTNRPSTLGSPLISLSPQPKGCGCCGPILVVFPKGRDLACSTPRSSLFPRPSTLVPPSHSNVCPVKFFLLPFCLPCAKILLFPASLP